MVNWIWSSVSLKSEFEWYSLRLLLRQRFPSKSDLGVLRWSYKLSRELARRMRFYRGELDVAHPPFPEESQAACKAADGPVPISAPKIQYTPADDKIIDAFHRATCMSNVYVCHRRKCLTNAIKCSVVETTWHSVRVYRPFPPIAAAQILSQIRAGLVQ